MEQAVSLRQLADRMNLIEKEIRLIKEAGGTTPGQIHTLSTEYLVSCPRFCLRFRLL